MFKSSSNRSNQNQQSNRFRVPSGRGRGPVNREGSRFNNRSSEGTGAGRGRGRGGAGAGRGRAPYHRRGRNGFRGRKEPKKAVFSTFKYPKTVDEFKEYVAPGSLEWYKIQKIENQFNKEVKLNPNDHAEAVEPKYMPHCFGKPETEYISSEIAKATEMIANVTSGGTKFSWVSNKMTNNLDNTRRGKRYYAFIKYIERREKNKKIFESEQLFKAQNKKIV